MPARTRAIDDWESALAPNDGFRFSPVLTIELEKLWLRDRPILFLGEILDIATQDESKYKLIIHQNFFVSSDYTINTPLILSLSADKSVIDSFLSTHPDLLLDVSEYNNGIAVVAKILRIRTGTDSDDEGMPLEVKVGEGELIDIAFIGDGNF